MRSESEIRTWRDERRPDLDADKSADRTYFRFMTGSKNHSTVTKCVTDTHTHTHAGGKSYPRAIKRPTATCLLEVEIKAPQRGL